MRALAISQLLSIPNKKPNRLPAAESSFASSLGNRLAGLLFVVQTFLLVWATPDNVRPCGRRSDYFWVSGEGRTCKIWLLEQANPSHFSANRRLQVEFKGTTANPARRIGVRHKILLRGRHEQSILFHPAFQSLRQSPKSNCKMTSRQLSYRRF
jgi:hypothetical protein